MERYEGYCIGATVIDSFGTSLGVIVGVKNRHAGEFIIRVYKNATRCYTQYVATRSRLLLVNDPQLIADINADDETIQRSYRAIAEDLALLTKDEEWFRSLQQIT